MPKRQKVTVSVSSSTSSKSSSLSPQLSSTISSRPKRDAASTLKSKNNTNFILYDETDDECENNEVFSLESILNKNSGDDDYEDDSLVNSQNENSNFEQNNNVAINDDLNNSSRHKPNKAKKRKRETKKSKSNINIKWSAGHKNITTPLQSSNYFSGEVVGSESTPLDMFRLFVTEDMVDMFVLFTNLHMVKHDPEVPRTTASELYAFIGVHIFMGIASLPRTHWYWSDKYGYAFVKNTMTRDRFQQLSSNFVVADTNDDAIVNDPVSHTAYFRNKLNQIFIEQYKPSKYLTLDELMVAYKGDSDIKQYIPSKPHPHGFKFFGVACDSYLLHQELYEGSSDVVSENGKIHDLVLRLIEPFANHNHVVFADNYFMSPTVVKSAAERGIAMCGSVRLDRVGMPDTSLINDKLLRSMHVYGSRHYHTNDMHMLLWRDRNIVKLLYNHRSSSTRTKKINRWGKNHKKISVRCPSAIHDYFYYARSIDIIGQLHYNYRIDRKAMRETPAIIWWLINICIVNAYTLWCMKKNKKNHLSFREDLMHALVEDYQSSKTTLLQSNTSVSAKMMSISHFSKLTKVIGDCSHCSKQPNERKRTLYVCAACNLHMCVGECFYLYHLNHNTNV
jgi:hypothetical protein